MPPSTDSFSGEAILDSKVTIASRFRPFAEDLDHPQTQWESDIDEHFRNIFKISALMEASIVDEAATRTLQIIGNPTKLRMRGLAMACFLHWTRLQFESGNVNAGADKITSFIGRICRHLSGVSVRARLDFEDELCSLCIEKLHLIWRWFVDASAGKEPPLPRESLLGRIMAIVPMLGHLFRGGHVQHEVVLHTLHYLAMFLPSPDALRTINAILLNVGPAFYTQDGCRFLHDILMKLQVFTMKQSYVDPLCQLARTTQRLVKEWQMIRPHLMRIVVPITVLR
ncbi:hypothetical protein V8B97DRAFT_1393262 [Scleroderma yunnanense]